MKNGFGPSNTCVTSYKYSSKMDSRHGNKRTSGAGTGGGSSLGEVTARELACLGAEVVVLDLNSKLPYPTYISQHIRSATMFRLGVAPDRSRDRNRAWCERLPILLIGN